MISRNTCTISLDFDEAYNASRCGYDALEIVIPPTAEDSLEEKLAIIRELAYPLPVIARLAPPSVQFLTPLLQLAATAGLENIILQSPLLREAELINRKLRLGLTFHLC